MSKCADVLRCPIVHMTNPWNLRIMYHCVLSTMRTIRNSSFWKSDWTNLFLKINWYNCTYNYKAYPTFYPIVNEIEHFRVHDYLFNTSFFNFLQNCKHNDHFHLRDCLSGLRKYTVFIDFIGNLSVLNTETIKGPSKNRKSLIILAINMVIDKSSTLQWTFINFSLVILLQHAQLYMQIQWTTHLSIKNSCTSMLTCSPEFPT